MLPDPYYDYNGITIYHANCREILPYLRNVDLLLTDPPYGIDYQSSYKTEKFSKIVGDTQYTIDWLADASKLIKQGTLYLFCSEDSINVLKSLLITLKWTPNRLLVWDKQNTSLGDLQNYGVRTEYILYATKVFTNKPRLNGSRDSNLISIPKVSPRKLRHPAEKPVFLMSYLIMKSTNPGELVLDPFMGSGTTLLAAQKLGRRAIGIEIEASYCDVAVERLVRQLESN